MQQQYPTSRSTPKLNVLFAFPYFNKRVAAGLAYLGDDVRFLLDSGAFTAFKAGKPIALDDYCQFLSTIPVRPWRYFTLDVIGDADATLKNYEAMRERGFTPIPIFTRGAPIEHLDSHCHLLHGYALSVHLEFEATELDGNGWVVDFGSLSTLKEWLQLKFDHTLVVSEDDPQRAWFHEAETRGIAHVVVVDATGCERFAAMIFRHAADWMTAQGLTPRVRLIEVCVREHGANAAKALA